MNFMQTATEVFATLYVGTEHALKEIISVEKQGWTELLKYISYSYKYNIFLPTA